MSDICTRRSMLAALLVGCMAMAAPASARAGGFPFVPSGVIDPVRVNVLSAADAKRTGEFQLASPVSHLKTEVIGWQDHRQALSWTIEVPHAAEYTATALMSLATQVPVMLTVSTDGAASSALFEVDPRGFQSRSTLDAPLRLTAGRHVITLQLTPTPRDAPFQAELLALELTRPSVRVMLHDQALAMRADARWMATETFGVGFHWTKRTMPRDGPAKLYDQAVTDFDVARFVEQVASTGASFVYLTTSHSDQYLPAPIEALDAVLPGRTSRRDLIADLIVALDKRGMKLFLYYHLGPIEDPAWSEAANMWDSDSARFFANWRAIVGEMGVRYGKGLAGWWFDDGVYNYYYRSPDWVALARAAKAGNPDRVVCFNSWKAASATEFQDYFCGEETAPGGLNEFLNRDGSFNGTVVAGGDGRIATGQFAGLQAAAMFVVETDWVHTQRDTEAAAPKWTPQSLAKTLTLLKAHRVTPMINMLIYQDGSIPVSSLALVREAARIAKVE